ncbi:MAG TPA: hypothetical protein VJH55_02285 [Candidatus Paceibacterota bacterium]
MQSVFPFETTSQIKRYLHELTGFSDEFPTEGHRYIVDSYSGEEKPSYRSTENMLRFFKYLNDQKIAECEESPVYEFTHYDDIDSEEDIGHTKQWKVKVLDLDALQDILDFVNQSANQKIKSSRVRWNSATVTLAYLDETYTFQKRESGDTARLKLFKLLWKNKRHKVSGTLKASGKPLEARFVAAQIGLSFNTKTDRYNDGGIQSVGDMAKDIGKALKKSFPITITTKGGILLIVEEKKGQKLAPSKK